MSPQLRNGGGSLALSLGAVEGALHSKAKGIIFEVVPGSILQIIAHVAGEQTTKIKVCPKGWLFEGECPKLRYAGRSMITL